MTSSERARRIISEELARETTEPAPERIVTRLEQHRLIHDFYYDGDISEPFSAVGSVGFSLPHKPDKHAGPPISQDCPPREEDRGYTAPYKTDTASRAGNFRDGSLAPDVPS